MTDDDQSEQYGKDAAEQEDNNIETYTDTESYDTGRERFQEAETLIEGDHDNVRREGPHVLKEYSAGTLMKMFGHYKKAHREELDLSPEAMKQREVEGNRALRELDIPTPYTAREHDDVTETELIPGDEGGSTPLDDYIIQQYDEEGEEAVYEIGQQVGEYMDRMHTNDIAKLDSRLTQIVKDKSGWSEEGKDLVYIDNETVVTDATETDKEIEKILMLSEFKGLPIDIYQPLREGFDDTYTQGISRKEETLSTLRGIVEPAVAPLFGDAENVNNRSPLNALDNLLKSYVTKKGKNGD